ncbi:hypothetical protein L249_3575 [Ophiocordyceps polyrhachis-furcata BCC 54312]|uniref:Trafficking protein particle complex II-specific subunit 65 IgD3 domain-containing protein n=1 Tax=Ophiocordyceps polyrhachis-furcata BCC 54312 TaxID=1330021 RepID=A0A367LM44_9HYPO|nr:hypothetical protein L249_3575 [Ophiocordyceps polyrhachis-furcata BCC 54312]
MNDDDGITAADVSSSFDQDSYLTYMVPFDTNLDLSSLGGSKRSLDSVKQRESFFFDETVHVLLLLKTPWRPDDELRAQLRRLTISLEARIINSNVPGRDSVPAEETIYSGTVQDVSNTLVTIVEHYQDGSDNSKAGRYVYVAWKQPVFLARPRVRPLSPSVVFSASASVGPRPKSEQDAQDAVGYLPSGLPGSINLLESLSTDTALGDVKPRLSASRVSRVAPMMKRQRDSVTQIRAQPQLRLPILPVLHTRIRFSRPNSAPPSPAIVALLEIDFTSHCDSEILLDNISLLTADGTVENLNDETAMKLPLPCVAHDNVTFLYLIKPHQPEGVGLKALSGDLHITIKASVQVEPGVCLPELIMTWHAALDFTMPVNPSFAASVETGIQRSHRPSQLSIGSSSSNIHNNNTTAPTTATPFATPFVGLASQPDSLPSMGAPVANTTTTSNTTTTVQDLGITMSFAGPSKPIHPGDVFLWTVLVVNRSEVGSTSRPPRKLALVAIPRRRRNENLRPLRPPSTASRRRGEAEVADAVVDENVLHAMQRSASADVPDVVCLSPDTRVGPLSPGACHVVELQFLALREGVLGIEAIRIVDVNSQEHVDIRDLPTIVVEPAVA